MEDKTKTSLQPAIEAARARQQVAQDKLKAIKAKGQKNWTQADLQEALANFFDYVGI